ncbi:MAG: hypothetical protein D6820_16215, partial [Lentisphaerae bacterium]
LLLSLGAWKDEESGKILPGAIYATNSGGLRWFPITSDIPVVTQKQLSLTSSFAFVAIDPANPKHLLTADHAWGRGILYRSLDAGAHWQPILQCPPFSLAGKPSTDSTQTPKLPQINTAFPETFNVNVCLFNPKQKTVLLGTEETVLISRDNGETWNDLGALTPEKQPGLRRGTGLGGMLLNCVRISPFEPNTYFLLGDDSAMGWLSRDAGKHWQPFGRSFWPWSGAVDISIPTPDHAFIATGAFNRNGSIIALETGNEKLKETVFHSSEHHLPDFLRCSVSSVYCPTNQTKLIWAVISGSLYQTADGGKRWNCIMRRARLGHIAADPRNPNTFYITGQKNAYRIENGTRIIPIGGPRSAGKAVCDAKGRLLVAAPDTTKPGLWRYNQGVWERLLDEPFIADVTTDPGHPERIAIATFDPPTHDIPRQTGVWLSSDDGKTWLNASATLPFLNAKSICFHPRQPEKLFLATWGGGLYVLNWLPEQQFEGPRTYRSTHEDRRFCYVIRERKRPPIATLVAQRQKEVQATPPPPTGGAGGDEENQYSPGPLRNGDMEEGALLPNFWISKWIGSGKIIIRRDLSTAQHGKASLMIATVGGRGKAQISQIMNIG